MLRYFSSYLLLIYFLVPVSVWSAPLPEWQLLHFWFRDDDGDEATASGFGAENAGTNANLSKILGGPDFRIRFGLKLTATDGIITPSLEIRQGGGDCLSGSWGLIPSGAANLKESPHFNNGEATTAQLFNQHFVAGKILETSNPAPPTFVPKNSNTEYEWSLKLSDKLSALTTYSFRITNDGIPLTAYSVCPSLTTGQLGGQPTIVLLFGKTSPEAQVFLVKKDFSGESPSRKEIKVSRDGSFNIQDTDIAPGSHFYGFVIKDKEGNVMETRSYNLDVKSKTVTERKILTTPTLSFVRAIVTKGDPLIITGFVAPGYKIEIRLDGELNEPVYAREDGSYKVVLRTDNLDFGNHKVSVRQTDTIHFSDWSPKRVFIVSRSTNPKTDFNNDSIIDVRDWSIFLSLWKEKDSKKRMLADLNTDGQVSVADFSIFIRNFKK